MVRIIYSAQPIDAEHKGIVSPRYIEAYGLSTDEKPTGVSTGSIFSEVDTKTIYFYDEESGEWVTQIIFPESD